MSQLSRPYQIALGAIALLGAVWFLALRGHSSSSSEPSSSTAAQPPAHASAPATQPGASTPVVHGTAPGVEGLTRAINKAHAAVAESERNAKQLAQKSEQASSSSSSSSSPAGTSANAGTAARPARPSTHTSTPTLAPKRTPALKKSATAGARHGAATRPQHPTHASSPSNPLGTPARQALMERALAQGKIAVLLFWDHKGIDDRAVRTQLLLLEAAHHLIAPRANQPAVKRLLSATGLELQKKIAVLEATASEVTDFGSFTRAVQIYQTPTILIVNRRGEVTTITGLTDAYSIEQAIDEARHA